jgi:hypothetical protein
MIRSRRDARRALPQKEKTMSETAAHGRRELEDRIVARAWADESFRGG